MDIPEQLHCLFSATVEEHDESYTVEVPDQEIQLGDIQEDETYRVVLLPSLEDRETSRTESKSQDRPEPQEPTVKEGEQRTVEIEDLGDQGDGITRVERGFVVIIPDTEQGERVAIEITDVQETVAFAEVVERIDYYE